MSDDNVGADTDQVTSGGDLMAMISAGTMVAAEVISLVAQLQRDADASSEYAANAAAASTRDRYRRDAAAWRPAMQDQWWQRATVQQVAGAWLAASTWAPVDEHAAQAQQLIARRLAERGVDVTAPDANPADVAWLRAAGTSLVDESTLVRARFEHTADDAERMAEAVRAQWDPDRAAAVLSSPAWGALGYRLHEHEQLGGDLREVLEHINLDGARDPAALAEWQVEQRNLSLSETAASHRNQALAAIQTRVLAIDQYTASQDNLTPELVAQAERDRQQLLDAAHTIQTANNPVGEINRLLAEPSADQLRAALQGVGPQPDTPQRPETARQEVPPSAPGRETTDRQPEAGQQQAPPPGRGQASPTTEQQAAQQQERYAQAIRDRLSADQADAVLSCAAWPTLAKRLQTMEDKGHSVDVLVDQVNRAGEALTSPNTRKPAALADWWVRTYDEKGAAGPNDRRMRAVGQAHPGSIRDAVRAGRERAAKGPTTARPAARRRTQNRDRPTERQ